VLCADEPDGRGGVLNTGVPGAMEDSSDGAAPGPVAGGGDEAAAEWAAVGVTVAGGPGALVSASRQASNLGHDRWPSTSLTLCRYW
jgi:hypothetical protein